RRLAVRFKNLIQFIGTHSVPGLQRIFTTAVESRWSVHALFKKLSLASEGRYHPKNYTQDEIDLSILMFELGGGSASHALNYAFTALPCKMTIKAYRKQWNLRVSNKDVFLTDIIANIDSIFGPHEGKDGELVNLPRARSGHTLSFDQIATEKKVGYIPETDEMTGFCLEHVHELNSVIVSSDTKTIQAAAQAVREGRVHLAHEASVGAISSHSQYDYHARPVFIGPTCKKTSWEALHRNIEMVVSGWNLSKYGAEAYGPIWTIASDGDPTRRVALYIYCMHKKLDQNDSLYCYLGTLLGLNLYTGDNNITMDFDYKHLFKRICTLLCSNEGMYIDTTKIDKNLLSRWFERIEDHDWSDQTIYALLNPADAQNVPRAIKLIQVIIKLRQIETFDFTPAEERIHSSLCILAEMLEALLMPFIEITLTLSDQLEYLSKFAHISCALYLIHTTNFMPNQLFGDLQAMVKNAFFTVAKTKVLDLERKVFICLLGDDVLEALFGCCRMIGGHSPNCSCDELPRRFSAAMRCSDIYHRHPDWEKKPDRLKFSRNRDFDHIRPNSWKGEVRAGSCNLETCWNSGKQKALETQKKWGVSTNVSFEEMFSREGVDMLRPLGGKYVAISEEIDRSMADLVMPSHEEVTGSGIDLMHTRQAAISGLKLLEDEKAKVAPVLSPSMQSMFLEFADRKKCPKTSAIRIFFDESVDVGNGGSHDRLFHLHDLFATLIRVGPDLCLSICEATVIKCSTNSLDAVPLAELSLPASPFTVSGQILSLLPVPDNQVSRWIWNGNYSTFVSSKTKNSQPQSIIRGTNLRITAPAYMLLPVSQQQTTIPVQELSESIQIHETLSSTWAFPSDTLSRFWDTLYSRLTSEYGLSYFKSIQAIGKVTSDTGFPYISVNPPKHFLVPLKDTVLAATIALDGKRKCPRCLCVVKETELQNHMGIHIILAKRNVLEKKLALPVLNDYPCGFCGGSTTHGKCQLYGKLSKAESTCPFTYEFQIKSLLTNRMGKKQTSQARLYCTNIPLACPFPPCTERHWKYNMPDHIQDCHPSLTAHLPVDFVTTAQISTEEQIALGVPSDKTIEWPLSSLQSFCRPEKHSLRSPPGSPTRSRVRKSRRILTSLNIWYIACLAA
ncbi:hypothetical protein K435DRAFT_669146, partial [Dendrothele bispora CBS 962.96]